MASLDRIDSQIIELREKLDNIESALGRNPEALAKLTDSSRKEALEALRPESPTRFALNRRLRDMRTQVENQLRQLQNTRKQFTNVQRRADAARTKVLQKMPPADRSEILNIQQNPEQAIQEFEALAATAEQMAQSGAPRDQLRAVGVQLNKKASLLDLARGDPEASVLTQEEVRAPFQEGAIRDPQSGQIAVGENLFRGAPGKGGVFEQRADVILDELIVPAITRQSREELLFTDAQDQSIIDEEEAGVRTERAGAVGGTTVLSPEGVLEGVEVPEGQTLSFRGGQGQFDVGLTPQGGGEFTILDEPTQRLQQVLPTNAQPREPIPEAGPGGLVNDPLETRSPSQQRFIETGTPLRGLPPEQPARTDPFSFVARELGGAVAGAPERMVRSLVPPFGGLREPGNLRGEPAPTPTPAPTQQFSLEERKAQLLARGNALRQQGFSPEQIAATLSREFPELVGVE